MHDSRHTLVLLSGLPGTGKTRLAIDLAKHLNFPHLGKDHFQSMLRKHGLAQRKGPEGYHLVLDLAEYYLSLGLGLILDGVFPLHGFRDWAREMASRNGANFRPIFCHCSDEAEWKRRLEVRPQNVPNWSPVGWEDVQRIAQKFEPWQRNEALFLDAIDEFDMNVQRAVDWATGKDDAS